MVYHILGTRSLEGALENLSLEKTEGIPFFVEEFVRSLMDLKLAVRKAGRYFLKSDGLSLPWYFLLWSRLF